MRALTVLTAPEGPRFTSPFEPLLDHSFLAGLGWDPVLQVLAPREGHPCLPWAACRKSGCENRANFGNGLCRPCHLKRPADAADLAAWLEEEKLWTDRRGIERPCAVAECARPRGRANGLCESHNQLREQRGLALELFLLDPRTKPLPSLGRCRVNSCNRRAVSVSRRLCTPHARQIREALHADPDLEEKEWLRMAPPIAVSTTAALTGLPRLVQIELLYALQERSKRGTKTPLHTLRKVLTVVRESKTTSLLDLEVPPTRGNANYHKTVLAEMRSTLAMALTTPAEEVKKDHWNLRVLGYHGTIDFRPITQQWLREGAKHWAEEELPRRRGSAIGMVVRSFVNHFAMLSESLRLHRDDGGQDLRLLSRRDIVQLTTWMGRLEQVGDISARTRWLKLAQLKRVLVDCRDYGLTRPGQPLAGLADDFSLRRTDVPRPPEDDDIGRALPEQVMVILLQRLPDLERASKTRSARAAVELMMRTGRRPDEICALSLEGAIQSDPDGGFSLIYTDFKNNRLHQRLNIRSEDVAVIREQQVWVRQQWPGADPKSLPLFPRHFRNGFGMERINDKTLYERHREWIQAMDPIMLDGDIEFDKDNIFPYAYRHTYAQRHADQGTPVDVLCQLMGHRSMEATQTYYRVNEKRTRDAVSSLLPFQVNVRGQRTWTGTTCDDSSANRYAIGAVTTPLGGCHEPSNMQAGGRACPFRMRCLGCGHFRTDPSYLPELRGHLDGLLRDRERILAASELADWARTDTQYLDGEIEASRRLIREQDSKLDAMDAETRTAVVEASKVVRKQRQLVQLGLPQPRRNP
ncbi:site-specific integrase [Actinoplanes sp. NPDC051411]|uniref:tyrosine-type recombinase/integrase n=1 Tax=Actinoplanes sp. NPDC051411 TaxID=3155522 RepID=UPI0034319892